MVVNVFFPQQVNILKHFCTVWKPIQKYGVHLELQSWYFWGGGGLLLQFLELKGTDWGVRVEEESHPSLDEPL